MIDQTDTTIIITPVIETLATAEAVIRPITLEWMELMSRNRPETEAALEESRKRLKMSMDAKFGVYMHHVLQIEKSDLTVTEAIDAVIQSQLYNSAIQLRRGLAEEYRDPAQLAKDFFEVLRQTDPSVGGIALSMLATEEHLQNADVPLVDFPAELPQSCRSALGQVNFFVGVMDAINTTGLVPEQEELLKRVLPGVAIDKDTITSHILSRFVQISPALAAIPRLPDTEFSQTQKQGVKDLLVGIQSLIKPHTDNLAEVSAVKAQLEALVEIESEEDLRAKIALGYAINGPQGAIDQVMIMIENYQRVITTHAEASRRGEKVRALIKEVPQFEPTAKESYQEVTHGMLIDLLALEAASDSQEATTPSEETLKVLRERADIVAKANEIMEFDTAHPLKYGLEIEIPEDFDESTYESLKESASKRYKESANRRRALQLLSEMGFPIYEDDMGEIAVPKSRGYRSQLEIIRILTKLNILPREVGIHINFSGIQNLRGHVPELLTIALAFYGTDVWGEMIEAGDVIGFAGHSQKVLHRRNKSGVMEVGPQGLPILIEGERGEFRGLTNTMTTIAQLERGMPMLDHALLALKNYADGTDLATWKQLESTVHSAIDKNTLQTAPVYLVEVLGLSAFKQILPDANLQLPLSTTSAYLAALDAFTRYEYLQNEKYADLVEPITKEELMQRIFADPRFIEYCFNYYGKMPTSLEESIKNAREFYCENKHYYYQEAGQLEPRRFPTKTWERLRANVTREAQVSLHFRASLQNALSA